MTVKPLGPLDWRIAITDGNGRPTPEFQRRWNLQRSNNDMIGVTIGDGPPTSVPDTDGLEYLDATHIPPILYVSSEGSWLQVGVVLNDLLDLISNVQGSIIYRGATEWVALPPGTAGQVLSTGGTGANPSWEDTGGSDVDFIDFSRLTQFGNFRLLEDGVTYRITE